MSPVAQNIPVSTGAPVAEEREEMVMTPERSVEFEREDQKEPTVEVDNGPKEKPSEKILKGIEEDDVEVTFEKLAGGFFRNVPEQPVDTQDKDTGTMEVLESTFEEDTSEEPLKELDEEVVPEKEIIAEITDSMPAGSLTREMLTAIQDGRVEAAHTLVDTLIENEGHKTLVEDSVLAPSGRREGGPIGSLGEQDLARTQEQLTLALKTMNELAVVLRQMIEDEKDPTKKKLSLVELLFKITDFLFMITVNELTQPTGGVKEKEEPKSFKPRLFGTPQKPHEEPIAA